MILFSLPLAPAEEGDKCLALFTRFLPICDLSLFLLLSPSPTPPSFFFSAPVPLCLTPGLSQLSVISPLSPSWFSSTHRVVYREQPSAPRED